MDESHMLKMVRDWKTNEETGNKEDGLVKLERKKGMRISCENTFLCGECCEETSTAPEQTIFTGKKYDGNPSNYPNSAWYRQNVELVLATLATGMDPSEAAKFLIFQNIPRMHSFHNNQFFMIEKLVGKSLRKVAFRSMSEMLDKEIEETLKLKN